MIIEKTGFYQLLPKKEVLPQTLTSRILYLSEHVYIYNHS